MREDQLEETKSMSKTQEEPHEVSEASVYRRYAAAANQREAALCCPVEYAADFLSVIPDEVIERDYAQLQTSQAA